MTDAPSSMQQLGVLLSGGVASSKPSISSVAPTPPSFVLVQSDTVADAWSLMSPFSNAVGHGRAFRLGNSERVQGSGAGAPNRAELAERCFLSASSVRACASRCSARRASGHQDRLVPSLHSTHAPETVAALCL